MKGFGVGFLISIVEKDSDSKVPKILTFDSANEVILIEATGNIVQKLGVPHYEFFHPKTNSRILISESSARQLTENKTGRDLLSEGPEFKRHSLGDPTHAKNIVGVLTPAKKHADSKVSDKSFVAPLMSDSAVESIFKGVPPAEPLQNNSFSTTLKKFKPKFCAYFYKPASE